GHEAPTPSSTPGRCRASTASRRNARAASAASCARPQDCYGGPPADPHVTFVMYHMGHGHGVYIQAAIDVARRLPNVLLETSGMPMHTKIKEAVDQVGEDRVLYGSDIPFHHPSVEMQRVRVAGLTEAQLRKVFYGNAARLLNL
ncbi:MAG: amidohydrolase family protein, partial [Thermodesulfobacteriota bacterium]